nr:NAD-dependent epimerase/dehydratase [Trichoderma crystalligenum]
MPSYAVLGSTGNCGTALIQNLLKRPDVHINAYCRNQAKLRRLLPEVQNNEQVTIFEGDIKDEKLLASCLRDCHAAFLVVSTNDNVPGCRLGQDTATAMIRALQVINQAPKVILLSSATIDDHFSRHVPFLLRQILLYSASFVYQDLIKTESIIRAEAEWLTAIYVKPGALSVDVQRGHALSLTDEDSPLSYLDLAAAMIEAVDDPDGRYDMRSVSVVNTNGRARFPSGTPMCILTGLVRHFLPFLHPYLPSTGPS